MTTMSLWSATDRSVDSERGDTLIEVLLAVVIMSITVAAVMGALITVITGSAEHRQLSADDNLVKSFAEHVKYEVQLQPSSTTAIPPTPYFEDCFPPGTTAGSVLTFYKAQVPTWTSTANGLPNGYPNYTVGITGLAFWNTSNSSWDPSASACTATPNVDASGIQKVTVTANAPNGASQSLDVVVANPAWRSCYEPAPISTTHC